MNTLYLHKVLGFHYCYDRSTVRAVVVGPEKSAESLSFTNTVAYRGLVPVETLRHLGVKTNVTAKPICWIGDGKVCYPPSSSHSNFLFTLSRVLIAPSTSLPLESKRTLWYVLSPTYEVLYATHPCQLPIHRKLNIVVFVTDYSVPIGSRPLPPSEPWVTRVSPDELRSQFEDWGDDPRIIVTCLLDPSKWSIHCVKPELETYVKGRVALLGDAVRLAWSHFWIAISISI